VSYEDKLIREIIMDWLQWAKFESTDYSNRAYQALTHISKIEKANAKLTEQLAVLREACEFYGDKESWTIDEDYYGNLIEGIIADADLEKKTNSSFANFAHGGERARTALAKAKQIGEGE
jgi:hypothetical protein